MENPDLETLDKARAAIEEVIATRYLGMQPVPYFAPTDIGVLPPTMQEAELRIQEENDYGNRVRASIHMCLTASAVALQVGQTLMKDFTLLDPAQRKAELIKCAEDAMAAADAARHASAMLSGDEQPESDSLMDVIRL